MISEVAVNTLLSSSITGASFALIVYSVAFPIASKKMHESAKEELKIARELLFSLNQVENSGKALSKSEFRKLTKRFETLENHNRVPVYLSRFFGFGVFSGFLLTALLCLFWIRSPGNESLEMWILVIFLASLLILFGGGIYLIKDISNDLALKYSKILKDLSEKKEI